MDSRGSPAHARRQERSRTASTRCRYDEYGKPWPSNAWRRPSSSKPRKTAAVPYPVQPCVEPELNLLCGLRRMTDRLDTMAVGIQDESAKIARVVLRPQSWRSVVATPTAHSQAIKFSHRSAVVRAKTQMHTLRGPDTVLRGDCEFHPKRPRRGSIVRSAVVSEIYDPNEAERPQCSIVEAATFGEIAHAERNMVEHNNGPRNERLPILSSRGVAGAYSIRRGDYFV